MLCSAVVVCSTVQKPQHKTAAVSDASARISPCKSIQIGWCTEGGRDKEEERKVQKTEQKSTKKTR